MKIIIVVFVVLLFSINMIIPLFAHTTVEVDQYKIEVGWEIEPPVVGIRNDLVIKITEAGDAENTYKGVTNVFKNLDATIMYGGVTKKTDINSDQRQGYYLSSVIPTKIGTYFLQLKGKINETLVDANIPIEDIESTTVLDFPLTNNEGNSDITALKNAISSIQYDISKLESDKTPVSSNNDSAYDFAVYSLSIAVAAIVLAIIAVVKRK